MNLEGLTLNVLKNQLAGELVGSRIDKVFQPAKYDLLLMARNNNKNHFIYISASNNAPHIRVAEKNTLNPENPPAFCMLLRKHLENGRITQIMQEELERIITFDIDTLGIGNAIITKKLIVELTGKSSNIILAQDGIITDCIKHIGQNVNKFRQMLPARTYIAPPPQDGTNVLKTSSDTITDNILHIHAPLASAIIKATLGIGPFTAKEITFRAGLPADIIADTLDTADKSALKEAIDSIILPIKEGPEQLTVSADQTGKIVAITPYIPEHTGKLIIKTFSSASHAIEFALSARQTAPPEGILLSRLLKNEIQRLEKKLILLESELSKAENADTFKNTADNIMAQLYKLEKGMAVCEILDFATNEPVEVKLDTNLTPVENANKYYKLYNKAKRSVKWLHEQLAETKDQIDYLAGIEFSLQNLQTSNELSEVKNELKTLGLLKEKTAKQLKTAASIPLKASLESGSVIYIGKNNKQNDMVTFKTAGANDLWFHAKDIPGSHIILKTTDKEASYEDIQTAATLAAWFSKARYSSNIPVDYTYRKHVKKPSGAKPGFVIYENQKTLSVTTDEQTINDILK